MSGSRSSVHWRIFAVAITTILFSWPSLLNKGPFFIADTTAYLRSADAAFSSVLSYRSIWSDKRDLYAKVSQPNDALKPSASKQDAPLHPPLMGRSIYYGAIIYPPVLLVGEQGGVVLQCMLLALIIWLALFPIRLETTRKQLRLYMCASVMLALLTPLPFVASLLTPDYLSGIACSAMILLFCFWAHFSKLQIGILAGLVSLAAVSHDSNLPLLLAMTLVGLVCRQFAPRLSRRAALIGIGAVLLGLAGNSLFVAAVKRQTGTSPIRPPFLTARLIADGPGQELLRDRCTKSRFEVCRYVDKTPYDSDDFLWSRGRGGVFSVANFASQRRLSDQDLSFAVATFRAYPSMTIASTLEATARQLGLFSYAIWKGNARGTPFFSLENLPRPVAGRMKKTLSVQGKMPVEPFHTIATIVTVVSCMVVPLCLLASRRSDDARLKTLGVALLLALIAIFINGAITGGLSKPDARYNLRIVWLLPLFIGMFAVAWAKQHTDAADDQT